MLDSLWEIQLLYETLASHFKQASERHQVPRSHISQALNELRTELVAVVLVAKLNDIVGLYIDAAVLLYNLDLQGFNLTFKYILWLDIGIVSHL